MMRIQTGPHGRRPAHARPVAVMTVPAGFRVTPADLGATAATFGQLTTRAQAGLAAAAAALAPAAGMAGRSRGLAGWRTRYDAVVAAEWTACRAAVGTLAAIGAKLTESGDAYLAGDHAAAPDAAGSPARLPAVRAASALPAPPRPSTGDAGPPIPDALTDLYPGGDTAAMRAAAGAWTDLSRVWGAVGVDADAAFRALLRGGDGAAFSAMRTFWARQFDPNGNVPLLSAVGWGADVLGRNCAALAALIDETRRGFVGAVAEAVHDMAWLELPAMALSDLTAGITELEQLFGVGVLASNRVADRASKYRFHLGELEQQLSEDLERGLDEVAVVPAQDPPAAADPATVGTRLPDVAEIAALRATGTAWDGVAGRHPTPDSIRLVPNQVRHILDGDAKGGGHRAGTGRPGKSEFPRGWSDARILGAVYSVARHPTTVEGPDDEGRFELHATVDDVLTAVIVERNGFVVTAYPLRGQGVVTNPR